MSHLAHALARVVVPVGALEAKHPLVVPVPAIFITLNSGKIVQVQDNSNVQIAL